MQSLKLVSAIFYQQMIALIKLRKKFFISSKKLFLVFKIFIFLYFSHPLSLPLSAIARENDRN